MFWSTYLLWQCHFLHKGKNSLRYWRSFMTVGRPTAHWAPKKKKENIRKKKNCANYSSQYLWLSHNLISCKDVYNYIYRSHKSLGGDYITDISITLQESGGGAGWCRGELSAPSNRVWCFTAAPDNSLCFQMFFSRSSSLKLFISLVYFPLLLIQQNLGVSMERHKYTGQCSVYFESAKSSQILSLQFFHLEISQQISSLPIVVPLASSSQHIRVPAN